MIHGVDISKFQGKVDFHALKDNADFVILRATYGNGYTDANFTQNRDGARTAGLSIGFYHYAYPQFNQPQAEADWFTKIVSCQPGEILALDFEESYPDPVGWCKTFLDKATSNMGFRPLVYLNLDLIKRFDWAPVVKAGYGLWLAQWDYKPESTPPDTDWPMVAMRQYSNQGNVAGMNPVDLDVFYGTVEQFKKYGNPPPIVNPSNCDNIKAELDQLKQNQTILIKQAVDTAISQNDAKWQSKLDSANLTISQLQTSLSEQTNFSTLVGILWKKLTGGDK
jgi:GH25 family lysozyme M1 (1,4-beta-N-acetylmuramidase)